MVCLASALLFPALSLSAGEKAHAHPAAAKGSAELERIKTLAGTWEGKTPMGPAVIQYKVTGGGSAVAETIMPGTPHEMTTIYYDHGGKLQLTHYCSLGNHPSMKLDKADADKLEFSLVEGSVTPGEAMHMHALTLTTPDKDHLVADWTVFDKGAKKDVHSFNLTRKKG
jgi:hypothetical protein